LDRLEDDLVRMSNDGSEAPHAGTDGGISTASGSSAATAAAAAGGVPLGNYSRPTKHFSYHE
jgi:ABC-type phosphate transport system substrate-binding protein